MVALLNRLDTEPSVAEFSDVNDMLQWLDTDTDELEGVVPMSWSQQQRQAAYDVVYADLKAAIDEAAGFFAPMLEGDLPDKVNELVDLVAQSTSKQQAYASVWQYVEESGYADKVTEAQVRGEVDKAWAAAKL